MRINKGSCLSTAGILPPPDNQLLCVVDYVKMAQYISIVFGKHSR